MPSRLPNAAERGLHQDPLRPLVPAEQPQGAQPVTPSSNGSRVLGKALASGWEYWAPGTALGTRVCTRKNKFPWFAA